jgi:hypothetical protein
MRSPMDPEITMEPLELEAGLMVRRCPQSGGCWISSEAYWRWQDRGGMSPPVGGGSLSPSDDAKRRTLLCPESGTLLMRYRVAADLPFFVERSSATGGIWLDAGEWEALRRAGIHRSLHLVFTAAYQNFRRRQAIEQTALANMHRALGADFAKVDEFRRWLAAHPARTQVLAWLLNQRT